MLNLFAVALVYAGFIAGATGVVSVIKPPRFIGIRSRGMGAGVAAIGALAIAAGMLVPAPLDRVDVVRLDLDRAMPEWQFRERHQVHVDAPVEATYRALREVTADEILLFRTLTWIRSPHLGTPRDGILAPPSGKPMLDVLRSSFLPLSDNPGRELVFATVFGRRLPRVRDPTPDDFIRLGAPGFAKVTVNFLIEPAGRGGSDVTTETRVFATDLRSTRLFAAYWRVIYPGSALIRIMWLRAVKHGAENHP